jgi:hypothetical protein
VMIMSHDDLVRVLMGEAAAWDGTVEMLLF